MILVGLNEESILLGFYPLDMISLYKEENLPKNSLTVDKELHVFLISTGGRYKFIDKVDVDKIYTIEDIALFEELPPEEAPKIEMPTSPLELKLKKTQNDLLNTMDAMAQMYEILLANNLV